MQDEQAKIAALLAREYPFQGHSPEQLLSLASYFQLLVFGENHIFQLHQQLPRLFYVVYRGKVKVEYSTGSRKYYSRIYSPGDYFGEEAFLTKSVPVATVTILEPAILLTLTTDQFDQLLNEHPETKYVLSTTMQSRQLARQPRFSWIKPDESVFFLDRKHVFFLFRSLILPIFFLVASIPMITIGVADLPAALIIGVGMLLFSLFGLVWNWLDWSNDFYIVTNQRLVWIEKILLLYDSRDEAPLYNVLAVDIYTTWLGNRLDYGDVTARTYTGQIPMRCASQPYLLGSYIEGLRKRSEQIFRELEDEQMQLAIAESIRKRQQPSLEDLIPNIPSPMPYKALKKKVSEEKKPIGFRARMQNFLKVRYEQDGVITYRKSWPILVWKIWLPVIFFIFWMFGFMTLLTQPGADGVSMAWFSIMALLFLGLVFWLWYNYTDWKNDIYRLTPTQIFDIEKKPLGSEIKKSADLDNILTITHSRQFLGVLLNYGDVIITVGDTQFIFLSVYNPDRVHQDIANYQENLRQRKKKVQEAREKERMLNWLTAYDIESNKMN